MTPLRPIALIASAADENRADRKNAKSERLIAAFRPGFTRTTRPTFRSRPAAPEANPRTEHATDAAPISFTNLRREIEVMRSNKAVHPRRSKNFLR